MFFIHVLIKIIESPILLIYQVVGFLEVMAG